MSYRGEWRSAADALELAQSLPRMVLNAYDYKERSVATRPFGSEETLTQQHFAEEVDINTIVRRFGLTREWPISAVGPAVYGDFTGITDYDSALATIERANQSFLALPAQVREHFGNDPAELIRQAQGKSPEEFMRLFEKPAEPAPAPVAPVAVP